MRICHIAGQVFEVVDEKLVTAQGYNAKGEPVEFQYVSVRLASQTRVV